MVIRNAVVAVVAVAVVALGLQAQEAPKKNWKDRAEYDLYTEITKDLTPAGAAARLPNLEKWKTAYPTSEYADVRQKVYLVTYQQQNNHRAAFDMANEILKADPNDQTSLQEILGYIRALEPQKPNDPLTAQNKADLESADKAAHYVLANADAIYGPAKKPQGVDDATWAKTKPAMTNYAQFTLGWIGTVQKDNAKAEAELIKTLQADPTNAQASYMLASTLLSQQKDHPEKMPFALFEYARASSYDGPNALDANTRKSVDGFFVKAFTTYHGSATGNDQVKMVAKTNALPPGDFAIKSTVDLAKEEEAKRQELAKSNPSLAFWTGMKEQLTGDGAAAYWDSAHDAALPGSQVEGGKIHGKLISATPETKPKELRIAVEKPDVADVILKLDEPLPGKMDPGGDIAFSGVAKEYTKDPFTVTFEVQDNKEDIEGWTGKGPAGAARPAGATKKAAPKQ